MKSSFITLMILVFTVLCFPLYGIHVEYKGDYTQHVQPNGTTTFMATCWGCTYMHEYETDTGYTIIKSNSDSYWYYATLDVDGEYKPSSYKVGLDTPVGIPLHLRRSTNRIAEIEDLLEDIEDEDEETAEEMRLLRDDNVPVCPKIAVILVEFRDVSGKVIEDEPENDNYSHFNLQFLTEMLLSEGEYNWDGDIPANTDGLTTCGSVYDYFDQLTDGEIQFQAATLPAHAAEGPWPAVAQRTLLVNPYDEDGEPINGGPSNDIDAYRWLHIDDFFSKYANGHDNSLTPGTVIQECIDRNWLPDPGDPNPIYPGFDLLMIFHAGWGQGNGFVGVSSPLNWAGWKGVDLPVPPGGTARLRQVCCMELSHNTEYGNHGEPLITVYLPIDEISHWFGKHNLYYWSGNYAGYPRYIVGSFDIHAERSGDHIPWGNFKDRPSGNNAGMWNPRDRIKEEFYGTLVQLTDDMAIEDGEIIHSINQPKFYKFEYISHDNVKGAFYLENRRVSLDEEDAYVDFNQRGVGFWDWDGPVNVRSGYTEAYNENNLLIWHAENESNSIHIQFGDGHAYCSYQNYAIPGDNDPDDGRIVDGNYFLNGNDYFPSYDYYNPEEEQTEFGPGTFQNRANLYLDYSSLDIIGSNNNTRRAKQTGFCVKDIESDNDNNKVTFKAYTNYWGGDIVEELNLSGENIYLGQAPIVKDGSLLSIHPISQTEGSTVFLDDDIYVEPGGTFHLNAPCPPGVLTIYGNDHWIVIDDDADFAILPYPASNEPAIVRIIGNLWIENHGRLNLNPGEGNRIYISSGEATPGQGDWGGIICEDITEYQTISNVTIENSEYGIKLVDCSNFVTLDSVFVNDFETAGFFFIYSSPEMSYCTASNSTPAGSIYPKGLYCYYSSPKIDHCEFDGNYRGLYVTGYTSNVEAGNSSFSDNAHAGVLLYDGVSRFYNSTYYSDCGYNDVCDNDGSGFVVGGSATAYIGNTSSAPGNNSIYGNSPYDVNNTTTYTVEAEYNWWGYPSGPSYIYGSVDYDPWCTSVPGSILPEPKGGGDKNIAGTDDEIDDPFNEADSLFARGDLSSAREAYEDLVEDNLDSDRLLVIIRQLRDCYNGLERAGDYRQLLDGLSENRNVRSQLQPVIASLIADDMIAGGHPENALNLVSGTLRNLNAENDAYPSLLFQLGMIQHYSMNDIESALSTFGRFLELFDEHPLADAAQMEYAECERDRRNVDNPPEPPRELDDENIPTEFALYDPYPNPFNDAVTIRYDVKEAAEVTLTLFDVQGRKVKELATGEHKAGAYTIQIQGRHLTSGVYFCTMDTPNFVKTVKMTYLK